MPALTCHPTDPPMSMIVTPARTNPPGHPAWRIVSIFVFALGNIDAMAGLITASTVPAARPLRIEAT